MVVLLIYFVFLKIIFFLNNFLALTRFNNVLKYNYLYNNQEGRLNILEEKVFYGNTTGH